MRVEATFQDTKSRGWDIEGSEFRDPDNLNRYLMVLFLALGWVAHLGSACMEHGHRHRFDRVDRRDKGLLRLGRLYLRFLLNQARKNAQVSKRLIWPVACLSIVPQMDGVSRFVAHDLYPDAPLLS